MRQLNPASISLPTQVRPRFGARAYPKISRTRLFSFDYNNVFADNRLTAKLGQKITGQVERNRLAAGYIAQRGGECNRIERHRKIRKTIAARGCAGIGSGF